MNLVSTVWQYVWRKSGFCSLAKQPARTRSPQNPTSIVRTNCRLASPHGVAPSATVPAEDRPSPHVQHPEKPGLSKRTGSHLQASGHDGNDSMPKPIHSPLPFRWDVETHDLDALLAAYRTVRKIHGSKAATVNGLTEFGCGWIRDRAHEIFHLGWPKFKRLAGFDDSVLDTQLEIDDARRLFEVIVRWMGPEADNEHWLTQHGGACLVTLVKLHFRMTWDDFVRPRTYRPDLTESALLKSLPTVPPYARRRRYRTKQRACIGERYHE